MNDSTIDLLADSAIGELAAFAFDWVPEAVVRSTSRQRLVKASSYLRDKGAAEEAIHSLGLVRVQAEDLLSTEFDLGDLCALCSVRFLGGDPSRCFIEVNGLALGAPDSRLLTMLVEEAARRYSILRPFGLRLWHSPESDLARLLKGAEAVADYLIYAAAAREVRLHDTPDSALEVVPATNLDWYSQYRSEYDHLTNDQPELKGLVFPEESSDLQLSLAEGLCAVVILDGLLSGIIAAQRSVQCDLACVKIVERVLFKSARNRRLSAAALEKFATLSSVRPSDVLSGSVHVLNERSRRSAERAGRRCIQMSSFVPLEPDRRRTLSYLRP